MAWSYYRTVTIDPTKVPNTDQTNFTFPVAGTLTYLKTVANGGLVTDASGFDIAFFSDAALTTMLKFERVIYDATTGKVLFYVKVPSVSHTVNTVIYMAYANAAITTDQSDAVNAWDGNFKAVYHFGDGTTLSGVDSKGAFNLTNVGAVAALSAIGGAMSVSTAEYMERTSSVPFTALPATIEMLIKPAASVVATATVVGVSAVASTLGFALQVKTTDAVRVINGTGGIDPSSANGILNSTNWHYASAMFTSATARRLLLDGAAAVTGATSAGTVVTPNGVSIGASHNGGAVVQFFSGLVGEVRLSSVVRSDDWATTTYNSLVNNATFYAIGAQQTLAAQCLVFTQPSASVASGGGQTVVAKAYLADGVTVDTSYTGTATITLTTPTGITAGTLGGTSLSGPCVAGVFTFSPAPTADGPGFSYHVTMAGLTAADTTTFTVIGTRVSTNQTLVTAVGGNTKLFSVHDPRIHAAGALATLPDTIGAIGGRAAGLSFTAGTAPSIASGRLAFTGASSQSMTSAADARLNYSGDAGTPNPLWMIVFAKATVAGTVAAIAKDPTSTTTYPYAAIKPAGTTWAAAVASDGATPTPTSPPVPYTAGAFTSDSQLAFNDGVVRTMFLGKLGFMTQSNNDHTWMFYPAVGTEQPHWHRRVTLATSGSCKAVLGRLGASYGTFELCWVGFFSGDLTRDVLNAFETFGVTEFGANLAVSPAMSLGMTGNSLMMSTTGQVSPTAGDMISPVWASGTTSFPYYFVNKAVSARGSLASRFPALHNPHAYVLAGSSRNIHHVTDVFDVELALLADNTKTGPIFITMMESFNSVQGGGLSAAQVETARGVLITQCATLATNSGRPVRLAWITDPDRGGTFYSGGALAALGLIGQAANANLRGTPATYPYVYDWEFLPGNEYKLGMTPVSSDDTLRWNINNGQADTTHMAPLGYQEGGEGFAVYVDARPILTGESVRIVSLLRHLRQSAA